MPLADHPKNFGWLPIIEVSLFVNAHRALLLLLGRQLAALQWKMGRMHTPPPLVASAVHKTAAVSPRGTWALNRHPSNTHSNTHWVNKAGRQTGRLHLTSEPSRGLCLRVTGITLQQPPVPVVANPPLAIYCTLAATKLASELTPNSLCSTFNLSFYLHLLLCLP